MNTNVKQEIKHAVRRAYETVGQGAAFETARLCGIQTLEQCPGCAVQTPVIEHECLICGQTTSPAVPNLHVLEVHYLPPGYKTAARIRIRSPRFKEGIYIPYNADKTDSCEIAEDWLRSNGFNLIGHAEATRGYLIITDTFKSPKINKF